MDAFYASVELLRYPELRGQPLVIGGRSVPAPQRQADGSLRCARLRDYAGRGVITTATYEARALGVGSAMGLMKAAQLAPDALLLPVDFDAYRHYSRLFKAAVREIVPQIEDRGIDEIYLDLSTHEEDSASLARRLKDSVAAATGLRCSIAIAPNKLLAKIGSDLDKPDGLTLLGMDDLPTRIWPLPVRKINGIGPKADQKLATLGIRSIGELAAADEHWLCGHFGQHYGRWLHAAAHGLDEHPVVTHSEPKSVSRETTFARDLHARNDRTELGQLFTALCERVAADLVRKGVMACTIGIKLRYADFSSVTRDITLAEATTDARMIRRAAGECLKRVPLEQRLRLLGVRASHLSPLAEPMQPELALD